MFATIDDQLKEFQVGVYIITAFGVICSAIYMVGVPEVKLVKQSAYYDEIYQKKKKQIEGGDEDDPLLAPEDKGDIDTRDGQDKPEAPKGKTPSDWLKDGSFYLHGGIYMFVRLAMNLQMTIVPFYLIHVMGVRDPDENPDEGIAIIIALVPLV